MDWGFWGIVLALISLAITFIGCTAGVLRSWDAMSTKQQRTEERTIELIKNVTNLMDGLKEYVKTNENFHTEVRKDIETFKNDNITQQELCKSHVASISALESELKVQTMIHTFTKDVFEDMRNIQSKTTDALNALVNVIGKMEALLLTKIQHKN